jgi:hypothetical protein
MTHADNRAPYRIVLDAIPEDDRTIAFLNVNRCVNMTGARASDAARSEVADYQRMGATAYRAKFDADRKDER